MTSAPNPDLRPAQRWRISSLLLITLPWLVLQFGGLFRPGLLDDVDSVYIQVAREMLQRHDYVTPTIDGIRFFDKPPLMYWMAAGSMRIFGIHDWAARLPLALGVLALLFAVYALGNRLYAAVSPSAAPDRAGLYAALAMATSLGPYLYTRFYIPDILIALWMTLSVHLFLIALDRIREGESTLLPMLGFGAVMALDVLTKGLIGVVFPVGFVLLYLAFTRSLPLLKQLNLIASTACFLIIAAPWHILAALRNPPIAMPSGLGLPAHAGWAWFYLYNEHIARFLGKRIPHDYGQVPIPLFWLLLLIWLFPWVAFLFGALLDAFRELRISRPGSRRFDSDIFAGFDTVSLVEATARRREAALSLLLWAGIILGFFTLSSRQEYYHLPALPALALLVGALLAAADVRTPANTTLHLRVNAPLQALRGALYVLVPLGTLLSIICAYFAITAPSPHPGDTLSSALSSNPAFYNLSLGHIFDLTGAAMGFFRGPLITVSLGMITLGPIAYAVRRKGHTFIANLLITAAMSAVLLAAHEGLVRFYPILGSKDLALAIDSQRKPGDLILIDGELTSGSTLLFYTQDLGGHVMLVNGRVNGPWFGSFWPDAPHIFADDAELHQLWRGPHRIFLLTYHPARRARDLAPFGPVIDFADSGGKTILTNQPK
ncbi:phospholipid carrier-dependent glycosyltransferase [Granulicella sp. 5B5]|uniref:ArnT family glycosyltransferase n=1 Tax=Granulicella sp. 5B5 TaxID=1617967 RepID=UPI0015F65344|nr:glycosyltransferase family 39 protein [Granulicella sp. 5B5]QMV19634.1 phospholipid carrier-dependent glycosyltransferase [Granulicella sp. 5B5]